MKKEKKNRSLLTGKIENRKIEKGQQKVKRGKFPSLHHFGSQMLL